MDGLEAILQGLGTAIRNESDGIHFYRMAAQTIQDEKGRQVFNQLAQEEMGHFSFLQSHYRSFLDKHEPDPDARLGQSMFLEGPSPIFSDQLKARIHEAHFEMMALSVGIQLEISSESFYRKQAKSVTHSEVQKFFNELADWESDHYRTLLAQQEALKESYWEKASFAPF